MACAAGFRAITVQRWRDGYTAATARRAPDPGRTPGAVGARPGRTRDRASVYGNWLRPR